MIIPRRSEEILTRENLDLLLGRLHTDSDRAAQRYLDLRDRLAFFFAGHHCSEPETLADEVINRLIRRLAAGEPIREIEGYALGIARLMLLENARRRRLVPVTELLPGDDRRIASALEERIRERERDERIYEAMRQCLLSLPAPLRDLLIEYYNCPPQQQTSHRQQMAERLGLSVNALYLQIHRLRQRLDRALGEFLDQSDL